MLLTAAVLVTLVTASMGASASCPAHCRCLENTLTPQLAVCTRLSTSQHFVGVGELLVSTLLASAPLVLEEHTLSECGLSNLAIFVVSSSYFGNIDRRAFAGMYYLKDVQLEGNRNVHLHRDLFNETSLRRLSVKHNTLRILKDDDDDDDYLFNIPAARELQLVNCDLPQLSVTAFSKVPEVNYIDLSSNMIKALPPGIFASTPFLEELNLSDNLLTAVNNDIFENSTIAELTLHKNLLTNVSGLSLPSLTVLDLSYCDFVELTQDELQGFPGLTHLNLSNNNIKKIHPDSFTSLTRLINLDLSRNNLTGPLASNIFGGVSRLQVLSMSLNPSMLMLPADIFEGLISVFNLDLSYCGLSSVNKEVFSPMTSLVSLNLAGNHLTSLDMTMVNSPSLLSLNLGHNNITSLSKIRFSVGSTIRTLSLSRNPLNEIATKYLSNLAQLDNLDVSCCNLTQFWKMDKTEEPVYLDELSTINLSKNDIASVSPSQLSLTPHLEFIDIEQNPLRCKSFLNALKWMGQHGVQLATHYGHDIVIPSKNTKMKGRDNVMRWWEAKRKQVCPDEPGDNNDDDDDDVATTMVPVLQDEGHGYLWPMLVVSVSSVAILMSLAVLACFVLRWHRDRNSYGASILRSRGKIGAASSPGAVPGTRIRIRKDKSSQYQQLTEDPHSPATPVINKYNFPDIMFPDGEVSKISPQAV